MKKLITTIVSICLITAVQAYDFNVDGIYYSIISSTAPYTVGVASGDTLYSGTVIIPSTVTNSSSGITYSVTSIGGHAFRSCKTLTSITIPLSVTSIGNQAFGNCSNLKSVTIPSSVTSIRAYAFESDSNLISITIPASVDSIGYYAFQNCIRLTSITIPASVTFIGGSTFKDCLSLKSVTIPSSVNTIGDEAFVDDSLNAIYAESAIPVDLSSSLNVFTKNYSNSYLIYTKCTLYVPVGAKKYYEKATVWKNFSSIIELSTLSSPVETETMFTVFPNPTTSNITITGASGTVQLFNAMGVIVIETSKTNIDVSTLPKGMYYVKAGTLVKPLIIQ